MAQVQVPSRCSFVLQMTFLYCILQCFVYFICNQWLTRKSSFPLSAPLQVDMCLMPWFAPTPWSGCNGLANCFAKQNPTHKIKHELSANATMPFVFDMQALRQSVFQALPPSIYTLCTCYDKSRFFPGFHFLGKLMFVVFDMEFLHLWFFLGAPRGQTPSSMIT